MMYLYYMIYTHFTIRKPTNDNRYVNRFKVDHLIYDDDPDDIYDDPPKRGILFYLVPLVLGSVIALSLVTALYILYMLILGT